MGGMASGFEVSADEHGVLWLSGEFDLAAMERFLEVAVPVTSGRGDAILDLSEVDFIDSSGLRAILMLCKTVAHGGLVLRNPRTHVRAVIDIAGLPAYPGLRVDPPAPAH